MSTLAKMRGFSEALYTKTSLEEVEWKLSGDKESVIADVGMYHILVSQVGTSSFSSDIKLTILNSDWSEVDTFSDQSFGNSVPTLEGFTSYFQLLSSLMEKATRQASGADRAIENLLQVLGGSPIEDARKAGGFSPNLDDDLPF